MVNMWRNAASLILAVRREQRCTNTAHNYNLLCLKRHKNMSFMPEMYVFPGGTIDPADSDPKWYDIFAKFGFDNNNFTSLKPKAATTRPLIFQSQENEMAKEISLRITSIRETFEESGVLLCRRTKDRHTATAWAQYMSIPRNELQEWRNKIHKNATEFLAFCENYECYPDLWSLHEWSNWLTPTFMPKRFNTIFFLACLPSIPHAEFDAAEMMDLKWETPSYFLLSSSDVVLPAPQHSEFETMKKIKGIDDLLDIAIRQNEKGVQKILPICVDLKDMLVHIMPGDTMYPDEVHLTDNMVINKSDITADEFRQMSAVLNRLEGNDGVGRVLYRSDNVQTRNNRIRYIMQETEDPQSKSKF